MLTTSNLSAAQPQAPATLGITGLALGIPLCRAALTVGTSSSTGKIRLESVAGQCDSRSLERSDNLRLSGKFLMIVERNQTEERVK